jgi:hypothetical protein
MLSQLEQLSFAVDGRYATDFELQFIDDYAQSFNLRLQTYQKLRAIESTVVQQAYDKLKSQHASVFQFAGNDLSQKWKQDTIRVLRYSAVAMLMNDTETLQERFLLWFQTIMRSFGVQRNCRLTYEVMQEVVKEHLTPSQANLFCPILELNRHSLGKED